MKKVALITTWGERCGLAEYAINLVQHSQSEVDWKIVNDRSESSMLKSAEDVDIVHINYEPALYWDLSVDTIVKLKQMGKKVVITWHISTETGNATDLVKSCDKVVLHEKTDEGFEYVPMGIPDLLDKEVKVNGYIGTIGFPFYWKAMEEIAKAANLVGKKLWALTPIYQNTLDESNEVVKNLRKLGSIVITDWIPAKQAVESLAECTLTVFAYGGPGSPNRGIASAVRYGLAARRPVVVTKYRMFRDLFDYEDEIGFAESYKAEDLAAAIMKTMARRKKPNRVLQDMSWKEAANSYVRIYNELSEK